MDEELQQLATKYLEALKDGPVILYLPNGTMMGFKTIDGALAYLDAQRAMEGKEPITSALYISGGQGYQLGEQ